MTFRCPAPCEFEEIAYLLVHGKLPTVAELAGYKAKLKSLRMCLRPCVLRWSNCRRRILWM